MIDIKVAAPWAKCGECKHFIDNRGEPFYCFKDGHSCKSTDLCTVPVVIAWEPREDGKNRFDMKPFPLFEALGGHGM